MKRDIDKIEDLLKVESQWPDVSLALEEVKRLKAGREAINNNHVGDFIINQYANLEIQCSCGNILCMSVENKSQWQPIETAPKDGTKVLLLQKCADNVNYYAEAGWFRARRAGYDGWAYYSDEIDITPTHWMKLPDPPEDK